MPSLEPIVLYDIESSLPTKVWSPNTWRIRYTLNYKQLPYRTEWVEFSDIVTLCKHIGAEPTTNDDGSQTHTLPVILDPNTNRIVSDSVKIAYYLDGQYPSTPRVIRFPTDGLQVNVLQVAFVDAFRKHAMAPLWQFIVPRVAQVLTGESAEYFRRTRELEFGKRLEDMIPSYWSEDWQREWGKVRMGFETVDQWFTKTGDGGSRADKWIMGETISFGDFVIGGYLKWVKTLAGEDSKEWQDVKSWCGGRWGRLSEQLVEYESLR
ncbi:hypothetical protein BDN72DRAFT_263701 [Pluteus cervinus]|uniref:Uncharacterized protein n=1 Tax=Pluteus cervinus TaxID=181527 RepID=A0ACD3AF23_9AGAR|nr:hypothetical protein BDN72DRAFT_263701 [Pluteus cervinus]